MAVAVKAATEINIGKETVRGTVVTATRRLLGNGRFVNLHEEEDFSEQDHGVLGRTARAPEFTRHGTEFEFTFPFDFQQILLPLMAGMKGGVTGVGAGADKTWTFDPSPVADPTVDTFTVEYVESDFTNEIRKRTGFAFCKGFELTFGIDGVAEVVARMMGRKADVPGIAALALPALQSAGALLTKIYVDTTWAGLGTTQLTGQVYGIHYIYDTGIYEQYYLDGRADMDFSTIHFRKRIAEIEIDIASDPAAQVVTEEAAKAAKTPRFVQLEVLGPTLGASNYKLELDGAYYHAPDSLQELGNDRDGNMVRRMHLLSKYDATGAADVRAVVVNDQATFG